MAVVFVILSLLVGSLLVPLATQVEQRQIGETEKVLEEIEESLIGFAIINQRLPRPAMSFTNGTETATCVTELSCTGFIPWETLGVAKLDSWGKIIRYSVTPAYTSGPIVLTPTPTPGTKTVQTRNPGLVNLAANVPAVIFSSGKNNWGTGDSGNPLSDTSGTNADEDINNGASTIFISRTLTSNASAAGGEYDDIVIWLSPNILFNRLVAAGKLP